MRVILNGEHAIARTPFLRTFPNPTFWLCFVDRMYCKKGGNVL